MEVLLVVLIVIVSVVLIGVVLIQNPKGGGMSSNIAGGNQMFGVKKTTDILEKGTWYLIIALVGLSIFLNVTIAGSSNQIIEEVSTTRVTERGGRTDDKRSDTSMEDRKVKG